MTLTASPPRLKGCVMRLLKIGFANLLRASAIASAALFFATANGQVFWDRNPANGILVGTKEDSVAKAGAAYLCRGKYRNGLHPGSLVNGKCSIGFGGDEVKLSEFEVAHEKQPGQGR